MIVTSEQVGRGHPDKICDQISDFILNKILKFDNNSRVAIETIAGKHKIFITGEVSTSFDYRKNLINEVKGLLIEIDSDYKNFEIELDFSNQSEEIHHKVDSQELGAGDQGLMYGYATNETNVFLPIPFALSTLIIKEYESLFASKSKDYKYDSKAQVSYDYFNKKIININLSVQHSKEKKLNELRIQLKDFLIQTIKKFEKENNFKIFYDDTEITINNAGSFILGGAMADAGLTGRKIIADSYGGLGRHGGGAFSGKDYTKVDRSAAYYARYVARNVVENGLADLCEIQVSYIIGKSKPIAINVETFETGSEKNVLNYINKNFNFELSNIIKELNLKNIDYTKTTLYGHFGKDYLKWK